MRLFGFGKKHLRPTIAKFFGDLKDVLMETDITQKTERLLELKEKANSKIPDTLEPTSKWDSKLVSFGLVLPVALTLLATPLMAFDWGVIPMLVTIGTSLVTMVAAEGCRQLIKKHAKDSSDATEALNSKINSTVSDLFTKHRNDVTKSPRFQKSSRDSFNTNSKDAALFKNVSKKYGYTEPKMKA